MFTHVESWQDSNPHTVVCHWNSKHQYHELLFFLLLMLLFRSVCHQVSNHKLAFLAFFIISWCFAHLWSVEQAQQSSHERVAPICHECHERLAPIIGQSIRLGSLNCRHGNWGNASSNTYGEHLTEWRSINNLQLHYNPKQHPSFQFGRCKNELIVQPSMVQH